jgi:selenide,water dikinase
MVDDPFSFGGIAAANALSDVYAMGGRPISSLTMVAFPAKGDMDDLEEILKGGAEKMREAGCSILGGHSIADDEIKFGYAVTGLVHPGRIKANADARVGDAVVFTKRLGTGVISTALKRGIASEAHVQTCMRQMLTLNRRACEAMLQFEVHGCTDVTGFGMIGHAREMAVASRATIEISVDAVQFLPGAVEYARQGAISGGLKNNREFASCAVENTRELAVELEDLLYDPQTSGGLLIALPERDAAQLESTLPGSYRIGQVRERGLKPIRLI